MNTENSLKVAVILGSTREGRFSEQPGSWIFAKLQGVEGIDVQLLDLRDYPMPFFADAETPSKRTGVHPNEVVARWAEKVAWADAFVIVTPEYNHGYSAVLKNALDYLYAEWHNKAVGFVAYGGVAGARAVEQLRQVAVELQMAPIRNAVHIPSYWHLLDENGKLNTESLEGSAEAMIEQLVWWGRALKLAREGLKRT